MDTEIGSDFPREIVDVLSVLSDERVRKVFVVLAKHDEGIGEGDLFDEFSSRSESSVEYDLDRLLRVGLINKRVAETDGFMFRMKYEVSAFGWRVIDNLFMILGEANDC